MPKKTYMYAVQRASGHELVFAKIETAKVSSVEAQLLDNGLVRLVHDGEVVATSTSYVTDPDEELTLYRWVAGEKTAKPVTQRVKATSEESK